MSQANLPSRRFNLYNFTLLRELNFLSPYLPFSPTFPSPDWQAQFTGSLALFWQNEILGIELANIFSSF